MDTETMIAKGNCERIGVDGKIGGSTADGRKFDYEVEFKNHTEAFLEVKKVLTEGDAKVIDSLSEISAIGHRIVQGGALFNESVLVTDEVIKGIESLCDLAPLHNPAHIQGINACIDVFGKDVPQVTVFDNSFHSTMPPEAYIFPIPYEYYEKYQVRRYGFHGTSHRFVSARCAEVMGKDIKDLKIVTCHLGNGSSIAAVVDGKCFDTIMGVTPLEGIMMGTRCGSIDPAIVPIIMKKEGLTPDQMDAVMNKKSCMLGICGTSDNRTIESRAKEGDERAKLVESMLCHQLTKYIGSYAAAMGGVDAIVFTGGIGENNPQYRDRVCDKLKFMGVEIDYAVNDQMRRGPEGEISTPNSKVKVYVVCTNEELMIARDTKEIVEAL